MDSSSTQEVKIMKHAKTTFYCWYSHTPRLIFSAAAATLALALALAASRSAARAALCTVRRPYHVRQQADETEKAEGRQPGSTCSQPLTFRAQVVPFPLRLAPCGPLRRRCGERCRSHTAGRARPECACSMQVHHEANHVA